jgi:DNA-binding transcriptional LysR family regulator
MIHITVKRSLASRICQFVLDHDVELGMLSFRPDEARLSSVVVYRDQLIFVVSPEHPLARSRQVSIRQLGAESFVAHNVPSPYRAKVLEMFRRYQTPLHMDVELPTLEAIRRFVAAGRGVALIPRIAVETELERAELIEVGVNELQLERKLRVIYRAGSPLSHAASAFLALVEEWASKNKAGFLSQKERLGSGRRAPAES